MKLYLTQHGEAQSKEQDASRPLTPKGVSDVEHAGRFLSQAGVQPVRIIHSGKLRARQTAEYLAKQLSSTIELESLAILNPKSSPVTFTQHSSSWNDDTMIVSHLPFLSRLVSHLINGDEELLTVAFQPGSIVCLERMKDGQWVINWMLRPALLN